MKRERIQRALDASQRYQTACDNPNRAVVTFLVSSASVVDAKELDEMQRTLWGVKGAYARRASAGAARVEFLLKTFAWDDNARHAVTILAWVRRMRIAGATVTMLRNGPRSWYYRRDVGRRNAREDAR